MVDTTFLIAFYRREFVLSFCCYQTSQASSANESEMMALKAEMMSSTVALDATKRELEHVQKVPWTP